MGKGAGCFQSKEVTPTTAAAPVPAPEATSEAARVVPVAATKETTVTKSSMANKKVYVIYYSMYGHIRKMAEAIKEGIDSVEGVEAILYRVPETLNEEILGKMHAPAKADDPVITAADLPEADGFAFGFPTRFGMMAAQMKAFFDSTGQLWQSGALVGKPATLFTSTATQGGGQETTIMTSVTQLAHHGMIFVPPGYSAGPTLFGLDVPIGGGPWGAGTFAGPTGARQPSETELLHATKQGAYFASKVKLLAA